MAEYSIQPKGTSILIVPSDEDNRTTDYGFQMAGEAKIQIQFGEIVAVGEGTTDQPMEYAVGDKVLYHMGAGTDFTLHDTLYIAMEQNQCFGTVVKQND